MKNVLLHRDVYACRTEDGSVLMDLRTGRYFGLDLPSTVALAPRITGWASDSDANGDPLGANESDKLIDALMNGPALLTDSPRLGKAAAFPVLRQTSCIPFRGNIVPRPFICAKHVSAFCRAYLRAVFDIKCRPLSATVRRIQARNSKYALATPDQERITELVRVFRFLRPLFYTAKDRCLLDSLALMEFLARFDAFPTWVIAVRTRPFAAHSWVLSDTLLLNERLETAEEFVPILAV
jgi:transglutaminase superfamily protein